MTDILTVSASGGADFTGVAAAVAAARPGATIKIAGGDYREKVVVFVPGLRLEGAGAEVTRIVWDDSALRRLSDGEKMGTFNSYTLFIGSPGVTVSGLTIENDAGDGRAVGQAVAVYADSDRISFVDCRLKARQDTLCTGPLPRNPIPTGINLTHPVAGLGDDEPVLPFRQYYGRCRIEGDVDFIFGSATAVFEDCEIRSLPRGGEPTYVAAPSTYPGTAAGFVFIGCRLTYGAGNRAPNAPKTEAEDGKVYLCRPWRATGRCVYVNCRMDAHIDPVAWDDWKKPESYTLGLFAEYGSTGPGARMESRPAWVRRFTAEEAAAFAVPRVLSGADAWNPSAALRGGPA